MKKKVIMLFVAILPFFITACKSKPIEIDATKHLVVKFEGFNGEATAKIESNEIEYNQTNETIKKIIETFQYEITPSQGLENGDVVTISIVYDKALEDRANVKLLNLEKEFTVDGLFGEERKQVIKNEVKEDGKESLKSYHVIDGIEIPSEWKMTEEEKQAYVTYMKGLQNQSSSLEEETGGSEIWKQGTSDKETKRKSTSFMIKDYKDSITAFDEAEDFGKYSSQQYKIEQIFEDEILVGYKCVFKDA